MRIDTQLPGEPPIDVELDDDGYVALTFTSNDLAVASRALVTSDHMDARARVEADLDAGKCPSHADVRSLLLAHEHVIDRLREVLHEHAVEETTRHMFPAAARAVAAALNHYATEAPR